METIILFYFIQFSFLAQLTRIVINKQTVYVCLEVIHAGVLQELQKVKDHDKVFALISAFSVLFFCSRCFSSLRFSMEFGSGESLTPSAP